MGWSDWVVVDGWWAATADSGQLPQTLTLHSRPSTLDPGLHTLDPRPQTLHHPMADRN